MKNLSYLLLTLLLSAFAGVSFAQSWSPGVNSTYGFVSCNGSGGNLSVTSAFYFNGTSYSPSQGSPSGAIYTTQKVWAMGEKSNGQLVGLKFGNGFYQLPITSFEFGTSQSINVPNDVVSVYICMEPSNNSYNPNHKGIPIAGHNGPNHTFKINVWNHAANFQVTSANSTRCPGGAVTLNSSYTPAGNPSSNIPHLNSNLFSNGVNIVWTDQNGTQVATGQNPTINPTVTTTYTATFKVGSQCTATDQVTVNVVNDPIVSLNYNSICNGVTTTDVVVDVVNYTNWTWYNSYVVLKDVNNPNFSQQSTPPYGTNRTFSNVPAGDYYIELTTACGVVNSNTFTIQSGTAPSSVANVVQPKCAGETGTVLLTTTGGNPPYTYNWSNANGPMSNWGPNAFGLSAGTYTIEVVSATGCSSTVNATVNPAPANPIAISYGALTNAQCLGIANGSMTANISGGVAPYSVNWMTGQTSYGTVSTSSTTSRSNLIGGVTYTITVQDANGCIKKFYKYLGNGNSNITLPSQQAAVTDETCLGTMDGEIDVTNTTPASTFAWQSGQNSAIISNLQGSTYTVTATATSTGCQAVQTYTVAQGNSEWHRSTNNPAQDEDRVVKVLTDNSNNVYVLGEFRSETNTGGANNLQAGKLNTGIFVTKYNECGGHEWDVYTRKPSGNFINMNAIDMVFTYNSTTNAVNGVKVFGKTDGTGNPLFSWISSNNALNTTISNSKVFSVDVSSTGSASASMTYAMKFDDIINDVKADGATLYFAGQFEDPNLGTRHAGVKEWTGTLSDVIRDNNEDNEISAITLDNGDVYAVANLVADADFVGTGFVPVIGQTEAVLLVSGGTQAYSMRPAKAKNFVNTTDIEMDGNGDLWVSAQFDEQLPGWDSPFSSVRTGGVFNFNLGLDPVNSFIIDPQMVGGLQEASANALAYANNQLYVAGTFVGNALVIGNSNYGYTNPSNVMGSGNTSDLWMAKYDFNSQMFHWIEGSNSSEEVMVNDIAFAGVNAYIGGAYRQNIDFAGHLIPLNRPQGGSNSLGYVIRGGDMYTGGNQGLFYKTDGTTNSEELVNENTDSKASLGVYPNPNEGSFTLTYASETTGQVNIQIFDITGTLVFEVNSNKQSDQLEQTIDLTHLSAGIYMVATQHSGVTQYQKFLIK